MKEHQCRITHRQGIPQSATTRMAYRGSEHNIQLAGKKTHNYSKLATSGNVSSAPNTHTHTHTHTHLRKETIQYTIPLTTLHIFTGSWSHHMTVSCLRPISMMQRDIQSHILYSVSLYHITGSERFLISDTNFCTPLVRSWYIVRIYLYCTGRFVKQCNYYIS